MTGFDKLESSLIDVIKEEQAKLGFKEEKIHLYYPLSSLNHFLQHRILLMKWRQDFLRCRKVWYKSWGRCQLLIKASASVFIFRSLEVYMFMRI